MSRRTLATIPVLVSVVMLVQGCNVPGKSRALTVESATAYFRELQLGTVVSEIEADLGLPSPSETEAPASDWPNWKLRYLAGDIVVLFEAERSEAGEEDGKFTYAGSPVIMSKEEYWRSLLEKEQRR